MRAIAILVLSSLAVAQEPAPPASSPESFKARRVALMDQIGSGVVLLRGGPKPAHMATFYQDHEFFYLSGINEPDLAMLLFPESKKDMLLVPPFSRFTAKWDGSRLAPGEKAAKLTRFDEVANSRNLADRLKKLLAKDEDGKHPVLWTMLSPSPGRTATINSISGALRAQANDPLDGRKGRAATMAENLEQLFPDLEIRDIAPLLNEMRGIKSPEEIAQVTAATEAAVQGIGEAMKSTEPGMYEYQIAAVARYVFSRLGAGPDAYAAIVGAGLNGCILHYNANNSQVKDGDLIVMDYGATVHGYATDVTRTFPANGKFTDAQRKLVSDVHEVQAALLAKIRPGASLRDLSRTCSQMLMAKGYRVDHGPCHHVGLAVHDMGPDRLEPGMILTVEPGAYLEKEAMGCRIEDTILVTAEGYINLSGALPSTPDGIEALMKLPGIAQQPIGVPDK